LAKVLPEAIHEAGDLILSDGEEVPNFLIVNKDRLFLGKYSRWGWSQPFC
jgi:hypothetical protein